MAKRTRENDFIDEPQAQPGLVELPVIDPEKEAMRARIALLEAQLAGSVVAAEQVEAEQEAFSLAMRYWRVELENALPHVVRATDKANAWDAYKREMGVIGSQYEPQVSASSKEEYRKAQARRHNCRPEEYPLPDD